MAERNSSQVRGAIGEARVLAQLLETGAAVNSLTMDDSGWDLHLHLPKEPMWNASERPSKDTWELGGHSAHVQVKARAKIDRIEKVRVSGSTVRGWVTGSQVGTPTFVILVPSTPDSNFRPQYFDPLDIRRTADDTAKYVELQFDGRRPFYAESFGAEADLWAHHGPAMFHLGDQARRFIRSEPNDYVTRLTYLVTELGAAALTVRLENPRDDYGRGQALTEVVELLRSCLDHVHYIDDAVAVDLENQIDQAAATYHGEWSDPTIPLGLISLRKTWPEFSSDLETFARRLAKTAKSFSTARDNTRAVGRLAAN